MVRDPSKRKATYERHKQRNKERLLEKLAERGRSDLNEIARRSKYRSRYGVHFDEYVSILDGQHGKCLVCGNSDRRLQLDHDHSTGRPRAILCHRCNNALGCVSDSPEILASLIFYLMRFSSHE